MSKIIRYCLVNETRDSDNAFEVCDGTIYENPFDHHKGKKQGKIKVLTREVALRKYSKYFDKAYKLSKEFKESVDKIVDAYEKYDEVFLGCYCSESQLCHADVIAQKVQQLSMQRTFKKKNQD